MKQAPHRSRIWIVMILAFLIVMGIFTTMQGNPLINLDNVTVRTLLPLFSPYYKAQESLLNSGQDARFAAEIDNAAITEDLVKRMEFYIHAILFFILALVILLGFKRLRVRLGINLFVTAAGCTMLAYFSEIYQNRIDGRGFETIDVIYNVAGIVFAIILFLLILMIPKPKKQVRAPKCVVIKNL